MSVLWSPRDALVEECSTMQGFANRREEESFLVLPPHNCVLSKRETARAGGQRVGRLTLQSLLSLLTSWSKSHLSVSQIHLSTAIGALVLRIHACISIVESLESATTSSCKTSGHSGSFLREIKPSTGPKVSQNFVRTDCESHHLLQPARGYMRRNRKASQPTHHRSSHDAT